MEVSNLLKSKATPWFLIFGGFLMLSKLPAVIAGGCMVLGFTMLVDRIWPEKWGDSE